MLKQLIIFFTFVNMPFLLIAQPQEVLFKPQVVTKPLPQKNPPTLEHKKHTDALHLLIYSRLINNHNGRSRLDESFICNFKVYDLFRLEAGVRLGERSSALLSYYQYKFELQSNTFFDYFHLYARLSQNVQNTPTPMLRQSNWLLISEGRYFLSPKFQSMVALGVVFNASNSTPSLFPTVSGTSQNHPLFKATLRYFLKEASFVDVIYGNYDLFNPYQTNSPFFQAMIEHELSDSIALYTYVRYQYLNSVFSAYNYFFAIGAVLYPF